MLFMINRLDLVLFFLFISLVIRCFSSASSRGNRKEVNRALATGVRSLSFDSDEEENLNQRGTAYTPPRTRIRGPFSDDEDEGRGGSSGGTNSAISRQSVDYRRPNQFTFSDSDSDAESSIKRAEISGTSGIGSDSPSIDQSESDRSRSFLEQSVEGEDGGTLVGLESPVGPKMAGGTPTLGLGNSRSKLYSRYDWKKPPSEPKKHLPFTPDIHPSHSRHDFLESPSYGSASVNDFLSPPQNGPFGFGQIASLDELYHSPVGGFHLNKNLWPEEDRRYIKAAKPPPAPGSISVGVMSITGRQIPEEFLRAVEYGRKHHNKALSTMKWTKTFISGNSATVYGIKLNGENLILKIVKHDLSHETPADEIPACVDANEIKSLHDSHDACQHQPKNGLIRKAACSADEHLVPFEYYIAEKVALTRGLMPAAASIANSFGRDENRWYLLFEEIPGISPLKYGENILERLAKPLIRQQLEALKQIATCHIIHLDAHWGNTLYSHERGIQLIDFGVAGLIDRFELPDNKASLIISFTLDRCLDCEASQLGRDFHRLVRGPYPIDGQSILSHPWLQY